MSEDIDSVLAEIDEERESTFRRRRRVGTAAVCEWHEAHPETGLRWEDMCGGGEFYKKLNFALYRRGLLMTQDEIKNLWLGGVRRAA